MDKRLRDLADEVQELPITDLRCREDYFSFCVPSAMIDFEVTLWQDDGDDCECWEVHWWNMRLKQGAIGWEDSRFVGNPEQALSVINDVIKEFT